MIASLPMYLRPENRDAHNRLWHLIRDGLRKAGIDAPDALDHDLDPQTAWARGDLVLSQICNLPYRLAFRGRVTLIGAADYGLPGCAPGYYNSVFVVRKTAQGDSPMDFAAAPFAHNDMTSQSGYGAPQLWAERHGFQFTPIDPTGSHRNSIVAVAKGRADIAAIDAQTWRIECQTGTAAQVLKVIGTTDATPGMSFVTRSGQPKAPYFKAIQQAIAALDPADAQTLGLKGIVDLPASAYDLPFAPKTRANAV